MKRLQFGFDSLLKCIVLMGFVAVVIPGPVPASAQQCTAAQPCAYVANSADGTVTVINTFNLQVVATVPAYPANCITGPCFVNSISGYVAITPDGAYAWVTNAGANIDALSVIDTTQNAVVAEVLAEPNTPQPSGCASGTGPCHFPLGIAINPVAIDTSGRTYAYVANRYSATVSVIDTNAALSDPTNANGQTLVNTVPLTAGANGPAAPAAVAVTPDGKHVWVTDVLNNSVFVIDSTPGGKQPFECRGKGGPCLG
jgi:YVTN family beta-propeller protein